MALWIEQAVAGLKFGEITAMLLFNRADRDVARGRLLLLPNVPALAACERAANGGKGPEPVELCCHGAIQQEREPDHTP